MTRPCYVIGPDTDATLLFVCVGCGRRVAIAINDHAASAEYCRGCVATRRALASVHAVFTCNDFLTEPRSR